MAISRKLHDMPSKKILFWGLIITLIISEYLLFRTYVLREISNNYPAWSDQTAYLTLSYTLYENILNNGLLSALAHNPPTPTTFLFPIQAAIFFLFFGASRVSALSLNFIYFASLQLTLTKTIQSITKNYLISLVILGLLLSTLWASSMSWGGIIDFRIDFMATCLFGILISFIMQSKILLNTKWTIIAAFIAIFLVLLRYIEGVYLLCIFVTLFFYLIIIQRSYLHNNKSVVSINKRIKNFFVFTSISFFCSVPFAWQSKASFYNYYVLGHIKNTEKYIRAAEAGVTNLYSNLLFYPKTIVSAQLGQPILWGSIACLYIASIYLILNKYYPSNKPSQNKLSTNYPDWIILAFLIISILVPICILTLDFAKSPIVGSVVIIPFLWLVALSWNFISQRVIHTYPKAKYIFMFLSSMIFLYGIMHWSSNFSRHHDFYYEDHISQIIKMDTDIGNYLESAYTNQATYIAADQTTDYLLFPIVPIYYEKHGKLLNIIQSLLGSTIFSISSKKAINELQHANVYITQVDSYAQQHSAYPFNNDMIKIHPILLKIVKKHWVRLGDYHFKGHHYRVYIRPTVQITGASGDWITSDGVWLKTSALHEKKISSIILTGSFNSQWLPSNTTVKATIIGKNKKITPLISRFQISNQTYKIQIYLTKQKTNTPVMIHLKFSKYFIPLELGINTDTRKLVVFAPKTIKIVLQSSLVHSDPQFSAK